MAARPTHDPPDPPRFAPTERPRIAIAPDGSLAAIGERSRIVVVTLPAATGLAEIGTDPDAAATELGWVGAPPRLLVLSRYAAYSTVHLLDPYGPRSLAEIRLEAPMRLFATVGPHALAVGAQGAAVLTAGEAHLIPFQFPGRGIPLAAGAAGSQFLVALPGAIEEWDPQTRMPKRRLRLPRPAAITALGGSERVAWMTTQQEPARVDVIPLVTRGQPKAHDLPEPIAHASGHPRSDLLLCLGADSHKLYVVDLDAPKRLRVVGLPGLERVEAAGLVVGRAVAALGAQAHRPLALVSLDDAPASAEAAFASPVPAAAAAPAPAPARGDHGDEDAEPPKTSTLSEPDFLPPMPGPGPAPAASAPAVSASAASASSAAEPRPLGAPAPVAPAPVASAPPEMRPFGTPPRSKARRFAVPPAVAAAPAAPAVPVPAAVAAAAPAVPAPAAVAPAAPVPAAAASAPAAPSLAVSAPAEPRSAAAALAAVSSAPLGFTATGAPTLPSRQAVVGAPVAAPAASAAPDAARWRDEVVAWSRAVFAGALREPPPAPAIDAVAARFELSPPLRRALLLLYGAHLCGEPGAAPVDVARVCERGWDEALGRGKLAESRLAVYERSRVRLAAPLLRALDELPPATGTLFGRPGAPALLAPWAAVAPGEPLDDLARRLAMQIGGAILAAAPGADPAELYLEARARGAVPLLRIDGAADAPPPPEPAILVVDTDEAAERLGAPIL